METQCETQREMFKTMHSDRSNEDVCFQCLNISHFPLVVLPPFPLMCPPSLLLYLFSVFRHHHHPQGSNVHILVYLLKAAGLPESVLEMVVQWLSSGQSSALGVEERATFWSPATGRSRFDDQRGRISLVKPASTLLRCSIARVIHWRASRAASTTLSTAMAKMFAIIELGRDQQSHGLQGTRRWIDLRSTKRSVREKSGKKLRVCGHVAREAEYHVWRTV
jgi:hypothetical protein